MFFTKFPHPANFVWVENWVADSGTVAAGPVKGAVTLEQYADGVSRVVIRDERTWRVDPNLIALNTPEAGEGCVRIGADFSLSVGDETGAVLVETPAGEGFGVSGEAHLFQWVVPAETKFFGLGGKWMKRLEMSGLRTKFWNTDVWSDFHFGQWGGHDVDPPYFSTPYLCARVGEHYIGFLLHNPGTTFFETPGTDESRVFVEWQRTWPNLLMGSECGQPDLWVIRGTSLAEVTRKLQKLVGVTPMPPVWSLGFHQSRWGYGGEKDLLALDKKFAKEGVPCAGLWLDLDYMRGYRIFDVDKGMFPRGAAPVAKALAKNGRRVVPIIDPGVKREEGYSVYDDGLKSGVFCQGVTGKPYVGLVWPGETVFPDFMKESARTWWTRYAREFRASGFGAAWVDMNDPSTGPVDPNGMLFRDGQDAHALHRNQYSLGMQMATVAGFREACPNERPFLLSRSGFIGSSRYSAIWAGDNVSNEHYLQMTVPIGVGLSLSGMAFHGNDLGGFGGAASPKLMLRWLQACVLYPFYRNHSTANSPMEEPWRYPKSVREEIYHAIRLRHRFVPHLANLFARHEETGEPLMRPMLYEFDDAQWDECIDQFMIGEDLLHAPVLEEKGLSRTVRLPEGAWFDLRSGEWTEGTFETEVGLHESPLYVRAGGVVAVQPEVPTETAVDLREVALIVAAPEGWTGTRTMTYAADDGVSLDYQKGQRSVVTVTVEGTQAGLSIRVEQTADGFGPLSPRIWVTGPGAVFLNGNKNIPIEIRTRFTGSPISLFELR